MAKLPNDKEREQLEQEIGNEEYRPLLQRLQRDHPFYRDFTTWGEVVAFMRKGSSKDPLKDEVLRPIIAAHAEDGDARWRTILLVGFWPKLKAVCVRRREWDTNFDELWANTVWTFLQAVCRLDLARRPQRLAQKLINDTTWRLGVEYRRERKQVATEIPTDPELIEVMAGGAEDPGFAEMEIREEQEACIERLREHMEAGRITEIDLHLLVGTLVYDKLLRECAEETGLSYQAAKKRRQRAGAAIRRFEESQGISAEPCPHLSSCPPSVLLETNCSTNSGGPRR